MDNNHAKMKWKRWTIGNIPISHRFLFHAASISILQKGLKSTLRFLNLLLHPKIFFLCAVLFLIITGRYRYLLREVVDPLGFLFGIAIGTVNYHSTIALVFGKILGIRVYLHNLFIAFIDRRPSMLRIVILAGRAVYEEFFWRGTIQVLLGNGIMGIFFTAFLFTLRHFYLYRKIKRPLTAILIMEFFGFSLVLGVMYMFSQRIMLVIAIHLMRNFLLVAQCSFSETCEKETRRAYFI